MQTPLFDSVKRRDDNLMTARNMNSGHEVYSFFQKLQLRLNKWNFLFLHFFFVLKTFFFWWSKGAINSMDLVEWFRIKQVFYVQNYRTNKIYNTRGRILGSPPKVPLSFQFSLTNLRAVYFILQYELMINKWDNNNNKKKRWHNLSRCTLHTESL